MYYYIQTFGCQMNENDSKHIAALLKAAGHLPCNEVEDADIIIINTCCVRESAENRALGFIGSLKHLKDQKSELVIAVCGCMSQKEGNADILASKYRHIGIIIGTFAIAFLPQYIEEYMATGQRIIDIAERYDIEEPAYTIPERASELPHKAQVNINFGCNNFCTYCIVPYVRGRERSRKPAEIIAEITALAKSGVKEVQLLGQNVNSYGKDMGAEGWNFAQLLSAVSDIDGIERIRYMTSHPRDFNRELAEVIAALPKVCSHFHLPVQSGCDRILQMMNRGYTTAQYKEKIDIIHELIADATITTDIIVGFPGETDADFEQTLHFLQEIEFDAAYTFIYSKRSGTVAAEFPNHLPAEVKKERLQVLMDIQNPISLKQNQKLIGTVQQIMVDGVSKNREDMLSGRTPGNKIAVFPQRSNLQPGDIIPLKIDAAKTWNLLGQYLK